MTAIFFDILPNFYCTANNIFILRLSLYLKIRVNNKREKISSNEVFSAKRAVLSKHGMTVAQLLIVPFSTHFPHFQRSPIDVCTFHTKNTLIFAFSKVKNARIYENERNEQSKTKQILAQLQYYFVSQN